MTRDDKIRRLMDAGPEDARRLALDRLDEAARHTRTWGSPEHRSARDQAEKSCDDARRQLESLSDDALDARLSALVG